MSNATKPAISKLRSLKTNARYVRWLLDGGFDVSYGKLETGEYIVNITDGIPWHKVAQESADSPEAAFAAAAEAFAKWTAKYGDQNDS